MVEKEIEKLDDDVTMKSYRTWFDCFSANASVYMPEFLKTMEKKRAEAAADLENKMNETESWHLIKKNNLIVDISWVTKMLTPHDCNYWFLFIIAIKATWLFNSSSF